MPKKDLILETHRFSIFYGVMCCLFLYTPIYLISFGLFFIFKKNQNFVFAWILFFILSHHFMYFPPMGCGFMAVVFLQGLFRLLVFILSFYLALV